jgi:hypothetical protein
LVLVLSLFCNNVVFAYDYESDNTSSSDDSLAKKVIDHITNYTYYLMCQVGAVCDADFIQAIVNKNEYAELYKENTKVETDSDGNEYLVVDKSVTDYLLEQLNSYAQEQQGYTLFPTIKASSLRLSYFSLTDYYSVICNQLLSDGVGVIYSRNSGDNLFYADFSDYVSNYLCVYHTDSDGTDYITFYESISSGISYIPLYNVYTNGIGSSPNNNRKVSQFYSVSDFNSVIDEYGDSTYTRLFSNCKIVSLTGFSIPAFANLSDAVNYQMSNGIYYTTNDYTGVGTDITISLDTLKTITDDSIDYSVLYDTLINMIKENQDSGNDLTYEELGTLTQSVIDSMADLKATIVSDDNVTHTLLQNILDSLNEFKNKYVPWSGSNNDNSSSSLTYTTVLTAIKSNLDTIIDSISDFKSSVDDKLDNIYDMLKSIRNWSIVDTITDLGDMLADWASFVKDLLDDVESGVSVIVESVSDVADTLSKKFPFSIPWDIAFLIAFLADTPKTPVFEVPFNFPLYGIEYTFTFDMSQFEAVSKISRLILTMLFSLGLLKLTNNIVSTKKR